MLHKMFVRLSDKTGQGKGNGKGIAKGMAT